MAVDPFRKPRIPLVEESGVLLGFPCPYCTALQTPTLELCGCYACSRCLRHTSPRAYERALHITAEILNHPSPN